MTVPIAQSNATLRKRFGAWLKEKRNEAGLTQLEMCAGLDYSQPTMVSQVERGSSALPEHDIQTWAGLLKITSEEFTKQYMYYCRPFIYEAMYGPDPYRLEGLARSDKTISPRPKKVKVASA